MTTGKNIALTRQTFVGNVYKHNGEESLFCEPGKHFGICSDLLFLLLKSERYFLKQEVLMANSQKVF